MSATTRAIYDFLSDEEQHFREEVLDVAMAATLAVDYPRCIKEGKRTRKERPANIQEYAHSGARHFARNNLMIAERNKKVITTGKNDNARCRMPVSFAREWVEARKVEKQHKQIDPVTEQEFGDVTYYAGMTEWEGWAYAPLIARDIAHVRPSLSIPISRLKKAFPGWDILEGPDGLLSISAHPGAPVKEVVTQWFNDNDIHHDGVRDAKNVKRRNLNQLLPSFYQDLMEKNVYFGKSLVARRYQASMKKLVGDDKDEISANTMLWIVELATSFDATRGRPFGTWVTNQIPRKIQDLNRATHGRTASDGEMQLSKARTEFETQNSRSASTKELRDMLGYSPEEMRNKTRHISNLIGIRSATSFDTGPDSPEIQVTDDRANPEKDILDREKAQQITLALLSASGVFDPSTGRPIMTKPLGFLITYLMVWDDWVKGDLVLLAGCADRKATDEVEEVQAELAKILTDLRYASA